jgi:tRNA acetyltransferase TAN1
VLHRFIRNAGSLQDSHRKLSFPELWELSIYRKSKKFRGKENCNYLSSQYKIELRMRNHTTLERSAVIQAIAECVPETFKVDLMNPELFILVEMFKVSPAVVSMNAVSPFQSVCGMSITKDYYTLHKYNVMELANDNVKLIQESSRVTQT